ncbi:MAG: hypothetical protein ABGW69_04160 [Nanoarchaeota archaeon]
MSHVIKINNDSDKTTIEEYYKETTITMYHLIIIWKIPFDYYMKNNIIGKI